MYALYTHNWGEFKGRRGIISNGNLVFSLHLFYYTLFHDYFTRFLTHTLFMFRLTSVDKPDPVTTCVKTSFAVKLVVIK